MDLAFSKNGWGKDWQLLNPSIFCVDESSCFSTEQLLHLSLAHAQMSDSCLLIVNGVRFSEVNAALSTLRGEGLFVNDGYEHFQLAVVSLGSDLEIDDLGFATKRSPPLLFPSLKCLFEKLFPLDLFMLPPIMGSLKS